MLLRLDIGDLFKLASAVLLVAGAEEVALDIDPLSNIHFASPLCAGSKLLFT